MKIDHSSIEFQKVGLYSFHCHKLKQSLYLGGQRICGRFCVVSCFVFFKNDIFLCFVVAISDIVHDVETMHDLC